jgi:2,4-dienoyl-CoA reductase-like NADH-dependent reductase (Old Yellow Enzyme family)/NAD(P)-dependent dehydrogenase (short-subunit alcohol dehydrogenase family)
MKRNTQLTWIPAAPGAAAGKQVVVVGGTGGLGRALSRQLAAGGARVTVVGQTFRDADVPGISFVQADLSSMREAQRVAALLPAEELDLLVFTTGIFAAPQRQQTGEGLERDMAVSFLNRRVMLNAMAPRMVRQNRNPSARPRIFIMGYPGTGAAGTLDDLNADRSYKAMQVHMNTVAGNEMLVLDSARRYPQIACFGLNPGLIKTNIRDNFLGKGSWKSYLAELLIGVLAPSADNYARRIVPLMLSNGLGTHSGALFNSKAQAILPSATLTAGHIDSFLRAADALIARAVPVATASTTTTPSPTKEATMSKLFDTVRVGRYTLHNRVAMAPMTRSRAQSDGTPGQLAALYYGQRATVGLVITEGTQPSDDGQGYLNTPGIYTDAHVAGWKPVTDAVHDQGGRIFVQLMHAGRMSHPDNTPHHRAPVAPSAIAPGVPMFTATGMQEIPTPRALSTAEVTATVADFRLAARRAIEAGADGVEIHGANGYLVQQFFAPNANTRDDSYGGDIANRVRFALEVVAAVVAEIGADRTAIRLSPGGKAGGIDEGPQGPALYRHLVAELGKQGLAYLHLMDQGDADLLRDLRAAWDGTLILNRPGRPREAIGTDVASGVCDLEAYGQMVLANPDFVARVKTGAAMNQPSPQTYYGGTEVGYTDYPTLAN